MKKVISAEELFFNVDFLSIKNSNMTIYIFLDEDTRKVTFDYEDGSYFEEAEYDDFYEVLSNGNVLIQDLELFAYKTVDVNLLSLVA